VLGEEHPDTLGTLVSLGRVRLDQWNDTGAEALLREALKGYEHNGQDMWERYDGQSLLGASLAEQKKFVEAEPLLLLQAAVSRPCAAGGSGEAGTFCQLHVCYSRVIC
jgi:hypothetical protein